MSQYKVDNGFWGGKSSPLLGLFVFFLVALALSSPIITDSSFGVHADQPYHYFAAKAFLRCLQDGDLIPRWAGILDGGRGNALFTFYSPLYYWLASLFVIGAGLEVLTALKCLSLLTIVLCQWTAFLFARRFFTHRLALLAAVCYVLLPAYAFIAQYSCFLPNALALGIIPLWLMGAHLLLGGANKASGASILILSGSALVLAHHLTAYLGWLVLAPMAVFYWPKTRCRGMRGLLFCLLLVLALTAFFWMPILIELPWIRLDQEITRHSLKDYHFFASFSDSTAYGQKTAIWNYVGSLITVFQFSLLTILWLIGRNHICQNSFHSWKNSCFAVGILGIVISCPFSSYLWRMLPGFEYVQFPWRIQPFVALGTSFLLAAVFQGWNLLSNFKRLTVFALVFVVILANIALTGILATSTRFNKPRVTGAELLCSASDSPIHDEVFRNLRSEIDTTSIPYLSNRPPYRPRGSDSMYYPPTDKPGKASITKGEGKLLTIKQLNSHRVYTLHNTETVSVLIETYNYPNWVIRDNGRVLKPGHDSKANLIRLDLPAGRHILTMDFEPRNFLEIMANWISALTWTCFLAWCCYLFSRRFKASSS